MSKQRALRAIGYLTVPLVAAMVAILVYGPARLNKAVASGTSVAHCPCPAGYFRSPDVTAYHPYVSDLGGLMSGLVLVGLVVALFGGMLLVSGRRHRPYPGRHQWVPAHVAVPRHVAVR